MLCFTADGRRLASGGGDSTILIWDVTGRLQDGGLRPARLSAREIEELWNDLAADDAGRAGRAVWTLAADPKQAVPFLEQKLREEVEDNRAGLSSESLRGCAPWRCWSKPTLRKHGKQLKLRRPDGRRSNGILFDAFGRVWRWSRMERAERR